MNKKQIIEQLKSLRENSEYSITEDSDPIWEKDVKALNAAIKIIDNIAEEMADVKIMLEQMELAFGIEDKVEFQKELKIKRLEERIKEE